MAQVRNTNRKFLDAYRGADGIKTGYTGPAGFNLTASAERDGVRIIATIFGGSSTPRTATRRWPGSSISASGPRRGMQPR